MAITVPVVNTEIGVSAFGAPVANLLNALTEPTWVNLSLVSPWVNFGGSNPACAYAVAGRFVMLRGTAKTTVALSGGATPVLYTPAAITPTGNLNTVGASQVGPVGCAVVTSTAVIQITVPSSGFAVNTWMSFDGMFYIR